MRANRMHLLVIAPLIVGVLWCAMLGGCASSRVNELSPIYAMLVDSEGFRPLMDGTSLNGWRRVGGAAEFEARDGEIIGRTRPNSENTYLCSLESFTDFELRLEFMVDPGLNSGVQVRSLVKTGRWMKRVAGLQVEIDPTPRAWTGGIYEEAGRGWLLRPDAVPLEDRTLRQGEWNELRIEAIGPRVRTWLNGKPIADYAGEVSASGFVADGFVALQVHGVGPAKEPMTVRWRDIRVREVTRATLLVSGVS